MNGGRVQNDYTSVICVASGTCVKTAMGLLTFNLEMFTTVEIIKTNTSAHVMFDASIFIPEMLDESMSTHLDFNLEMVQYHN